MSDLYRPDWPLVRISELAEINIGGTPSRVAPQFWATKPEGTPWIAISDLKGKYVDDTKEYITDLGAKCSNVKLIEPFTTVMSFKLTVGRTAITTQPMYCNEAIAIFSPKSNALSGGWLYHALPRAAQSVVTDNAVKGATLNKAKMAEMTVQLPPITEQRKIAQVLDTLDTAIHETEALIDKLKAVKQGLLHDLLTRGIDANGQLRPPQSEAPQLYKESPVGWIPREWACAKLDDLVKIIDCKHITPKYCTEGYAVVRPRNVKIEGLDLTNVEYVSEADYKSMTDVHRPSRGDIILSRNASFGVPAFVDTDQPFAIGQDVIVMTARQADTKFVFYCLQSRILAKQIEQKSAGSTFGRINLADIRELRAGLPSLDEQLAMVARLDGLGHRVDGEKAMLEKLRTTKNGLMTDLLTGRVRVTPLLESVPQPAAQTEA